MSKAAKVAQAWMTPIGDDPEAISAFGVARERLPGARGLERLARARVVELRGALPECRRLNALLGASTQFYNPHKERCTLRLSARDRAPVARGDVVVLVWEREGERCAAAERWLSDETGKSIEVVEGMAWVLGFTGNGDAMEAAEDMTGLRGRRHGLLCNPHAQGAVIATKPIPLPWLTTAVAAQRRA